LRIGMVVSGVVLAISGAVLVVLFYLTDMISQFLSLLQLSAIAGALILVGTILLVVGVVTGPRPTTGALPGPQVAFGAICPRCGRGLPLVTGKIKCPYCGKKVIPLIPRGTTQPQHQVQRPSQQTVPLQSMQRFCTYCGAPLHPLSSFCQQCGRQLTA
jgi:DNA-directed RNA polymerase subunit RPC12/RpoP